MVYRGLSWSIMVYHDLSWFIIVYHGLSCFIMFFSWSIMVYHGLSWFIMVYHDLSWFIMIYHGLSWFHHGHCISFHVVQCSYWWFTVSPTMGLGWTAPQGACCSRHPWHRDLWHSGNSPGDVRGHPSRSGNPQGMWIPSWIDDHAPPFDICENGSHGLISPVIFRLMIHYNY
jgi:hypothetical protein